VQPVRKEKQLLLKKVQSHANENVKNQQQFQHPENYLFNREHGLHKMQGNSRVSPKAGPRIPDLTKVNQLSNHLTGLSLLHLHCFWQHCASKT
jgi:hypothetical protein